MEDMSAELTELILRKCRKRLESYEEEEQDEYSDIEQFLDRLEEGETIQEEEPFEDILADKRRKYTVQEEFSYLLYNDLLKYFVKEWDGQYLRKKPKKHFEDDSEDDYEEYEEIEEIDNDEDTNKLRGEESGSVEYNNDKSEVQSNLPWKLTLYDEFANITFINSNTYSGRISRKMMEGEGVYRWSNGAQYKGHFQQNRMHGRGFLEWNSVCWYEGDFENGLRHGRGLIVDGDIRYMYTGQWYKGQKHGKGYCRYGDKGTYDGDWTLNKMNGVGLRIYASGARYVGQWKNGLRHGKGTMAWTDGSVYRGEWKCGTMNGYGMYIWDGFFNQTLTWPQEASYTGYWRNGMRHGKGVQKFKSVGGAKYFGYWKDNKKHGHGVIIGNNGERFEADPLFLNDILVSSDGTDDTVDQLATNTKGHCVRVEKEIEPQFLEKAEKLKEAPITPVMRPEQFPSLSYHLTRLLNPKALEPPYIPLVPSGNCYSCKNRSCSCLKPHLSGKAMSEEKVSETDARHPNWESEERSTYDYITSHIAQLRQIYDDYAKLFTESPPMCTLAMSRLCLWQLWRDCNINKKEHSLVEIDRYIAKNETTYVEGLHNPFEKIEIWQFLHALLEIAWHLYTRHDNEKTEATSGKLASGLCKLLENDIYPHAGYHVGYVWSTYRDILPMNCVFELYKEIGYPCSARDLLRAMCTPKGTQDSQSSSTVDETAERLPDGINSVTIGEKVSYVLKVDEIFAPSQRMMNAPGKYENNSSLDLSVFGELRASKLAEIMASICPRIKDTDHGVIINIDYELTFLEFYEILLEATKQLLSLKKKVEKEMLAKEIEAGVISSENNLQDNASSRATERQQTRKRQKVKDKTAR